MRESYDSNLKKAMHLYAQKSAEDFPTDDVVSDITFSPAFEKKMDKEIRRRKHSYFRIFNTAAKRAASIAAILVLLLTVSLSVEAIRTPLTNMVKLIFSDHVELEAEGDVAETIVNIYGITELPEGFKLTTSSENSVKVRRDYKNAEGDELLFSQWATKFQYTAIDEFTRLRYLGAYQEHSSYSSADFLKKAVAWYARHGWYGSLCGGIPAGAYNSSILVCGRLLLRHNVFWRDRYRFHNRNDPKR